MSYAIKCQQCNNKTKNPSGLCHLHENSAKDSAAISSSLTATPALSQDSGPSLDSEEIMQEAHEHFGEIRNGERIYVDTERMTLHGNGAVTAENDEGNLLVYNRIDEEDMKRPDIAEEMVDSWEEREYDDYASQTLRVDKDSAEAYEIRANVGRDDFRAYSVGFKGGVSQGYSYTTDEGKYRQWNESI